MAGVSMGACGGSVHADTGLSVACSGVAASLCGDLRAGSAAACAGLFAVGDGFAESSGYSIRICQDTQGLRLSVGARAGTHGRTAGEWPWTGTETFAASVGLPE